MRLTLHAVHADDYPAFHAAMVPSLRASRLHDRRFTSTGLTAAAADGVMPHLLAGLSEPRTGAEIEDLLEDRLGRREERLWWALRTFAPLHHAPTGPPWAFGRPAMFVAADADGRSPSAEEGAQWLVRRYLEAFGPVSRQDIAQFTILRQPVVRAALEALAGQVEEAFHHLDDEVWDGLEDEAAGLAGLLADRDPTVYRRYARWWDTLPGEQVRVLAGDSW